jgi:hypothetical protein
MAIKDLEIYHKSVNDKLDSKGAWVIDGLLLPIITHMKKKLKEGQ